jgi:hypothetical protein
MVLYDTTELAMLQLLLSKEANEPPIGDTWFQKTQTHIIKRHRQILVDWLLTVTSEWELPPEVLFTAVKMIDTFCSISNITRSKYQLLGVTALFVADKFHDEGECPPDPSDWTYICADVYTLADIHRMERILLATLDWNLRTPTAFDFIQAMIANNDDDEFLNEAIRWAKQSLSDSSILQYQPSLIAMACMQLAAGEILRDSPDIHYTQEQLAPCIANISEINPTS